MCSVGGGHIHFTVTALLIAFSDTNSAPIGFTLRRLAELPHVAQTMPRSSLFFVSPQTIMPKINEDPQNP